MAIPRHPRRRVLLAVHRMTGAAFAADIALEAGMERAEAVQHLRRLKSGGLVLMLKVSRTGRARWLKTAAIISPDLVARDLAERRRIPSHSRAPCPPAREERFEPPLGMNE